LPTVQISEDIKELVARLVADGSAANEVDVVEMAVLRYAEDLDDQDALLAATQEGIAASGRGDYVTISGPDDERALSERLRARASILAEGMRAADALGSNQSQRSVPASK
jgi:Arc/MetJ-type ribon-helix-helix transcriptional regulator